MTERQPTVFVPHGGDPCFFMDWNPPDTWDRHRRFLEALPASLPAKPKALLVISGHWEERVFTVQTSSAPPLLFDYQGFPPPYLSADLARARRSSAGGPCKRAIERRGF
jgi:aromatic ring-opening dioxygenase catalytic subunit (LigB family)